MHLRMQFSHKRYQMPSKSDQKCSQLCFDQQKFISPMRIMTSKIINVDRRIPYAHSARMHVYQFAQKCLVNKCGVLIYKIVNSRNSADKCISKVWSQICFDCVNIPTTLIYTYLQVSKGYECTCKRKQLVYMRYFVNKGCPFRKVF